MNDIFLTEKETADQLKLTPRTLQRWRTTGDGPAYTRFGPRRVAYREADILAWAAAWTFAHRAAELARGAS